MSFSSDLEALRAGSITFNTFARTHDSRFRRWAAYYFERWPQRALCVADLVQEGLLEAWRAVDAWDPTRGVALERFVEYQVGRRLRMELERVLGWPKKSRGTKAVRPISANVPAFANGDTVQDRIESGALTPEDLATIESAAAACKDPFEADVIRGIGRGMSPAVLATYLYEDPDRRVAYRLDSVEHTARRVPHVMRKLAAAI